METIPVSEFKAHALRHINRVSRDRETIVLTKRGKPVAELRPHVPVGEKPIPGKMSGSLVEAGDIVTPLGAEDWEATR